MLFFFFKFGIKITHVDNIFYIDKKCGNNSCQKDDGSKEREKILDFWRILGFTASDRKAVVIDGRVGGQSFLYTWLHCECCG